jgi:gliding motility-associated-like protein
VKDKDYIKDLFNEKLNGFEAEVRPDLWANISSQIGSAATTSITTGLSLVAKTIIGFSVAAVVSGIAFYVFTDEKASKNNRKQTESAAVIENKTTDTLKQKKNDNLGETTNNTAVEIENSEKKEQLEIVKKEDSIFPISITETAQKSERQKVSIIEDSKQIVQPEKEEITKQTSVEINKQAHKEETVVNNVLDSKISEIAREEFIEDKSIGNLTNVFTPNGDNVNDFLTIESTGLTDFSIVVIDNNSKIVFQSIESNFRWDGYSMNGELAPAGNYVYYITARNSKGEFITKHSNLRIQR